MKHKTWLVLIIGAILIMAGLILWTHQRSLGTGRVCHTNIVYKEIDSILLPVDTDDKAQKVIKNTFEQLDLTILYSNRTILYAEKYGIESYEKYGNQKDPGPPYIILIQGYGEKFSVSSDGTVERTLCAQ